MATGISRSAISRRCRSSAWVQWIRRSGSSARAPSMSRGSRSPAWKATSFPSLLAAETAASASEKSRTLGIPSPSAIPCPPSRPKMTGRQGRPSAAARRSRTPASPPSRKSAKPAVPDLTITPMLARIPSRRVRLGLVLRRRCFRPPGGVTRSSRGPDHGMSIPTVSPRCVWALKRAGQIQTGGGEEISAISRITPSSTVIRTGRRSRSLPKMACPLTWKSACVIPDTYLYLVRVIAVHGKKAGGQAHLLGGPRQLLREHGPACPPDQPLYGGRRGGRHPGGNFHPEHPLLGISLFSVGISIPGSLPSHHSTFPSTRNYIIRHRDLPLCIS